MKTMTNLLELRYIPISQAELFNNNAKLHNLDQIITSITRYGFKSACKWEGSLNGGRGGVVAGNGRVEALRIMEERGDDCPIGIAIDNTGEWCVPVLFGVESSSEAIARAYALDDNNLTLLGGGFEVADLLKLYDQELLLSELEELSKYEEVPVSIGEANLEELLNQLAQGEDDEPEPEYGEDDPTVPEGIQVREGVELGSIWALGRHRIMCGDSTIEANVRELLGDKKIDLLTTDPPYGVKVVGGTKDPRSTNYQNGKSIENDDIQGDELRDFLLKCFKSTDPLMRNGACYYIAHPDIFAWEFIDAVRKTGWKQARPPVILWVKDSFVFGQGDYHSRSEPILYGWKPGAAHKPVSDRTQDNVWEFAKPRNTKEIHPSVKPTELIEKMILNSSDPGQLIYDPFLGSGTTVIATEQTGGNRTAYGMELSPDFTEVILQRWETFTGIPAKRIN